jgi:hypothetical protein
MIDFIGGRSRTRTYGPLIKSQLLYQLSYAPAGPSARVGGPNSKHAPDCKGQQLPSPALDARPPGRACLAPPDGRTAAVCRVRPAGRGKSGLHGNTVPANCRRGRPQGKCHRKQTARAPRFVPGPWARVKRCGKSAPRPWQQGRQGKPHREQDRIGAAGGMGRSPTSSRGRGGVPASSSGLVA